MENLKLKMKDKIGKSSYQRRKLFLYFLAFIVFIPVGILSCFQGTDQSTEFMKEVTCSEIM